MISVVVAALNEEKNIVATINTLRSAAAQAGDIPLDIIIVDDGSTDSTGAIADRLAAEDSRIRVIHQPVNQGIGAGFLAALKLAKFPKYMAVPGDNDVPVEMMVKMMSHHADADLILAYYLNKEDRGRRRNVLSTVYNMIYMVSFSVFIQYVNGPAIYPTETLRRMTLQSRRFSIISEATIKCLLSGASFCEVSGYMQTGLHGSTSFSIRNLMEVIDNFLRLFVEVHFRNHAQFSARPRRVRIHDRAPARMAHDVSDGA